MAETPTISVVMAVYNNRPYLPAAVDSILNQTFRDFEFIIIDDGSTDGSGEWLEKKAKTDPRIRLYRQENIGLTKSLNKGIELARGEFIARMDGDDVSLLNRFEKQITFLNRPTEVVACGTFAKQFTSLGLIIADWEPPCSNEEILESLTQGGGAIIHPTVVMRREAVLQCGGYDDTYRHAQDYDLWCRLSEFGELANIPEVFLKYRVSRSSITTSQRSSQHQSVIEIRNRFRKKKHLLPVLEEIREVEALSHFAMRALHNKNYLAFIYLRVSKDGLKTAPSAIYTVGEAYFSRFRVFVGYWRRRIFRTGWSN